MNQLSILIEALILVESGGDPAAIGDHGKSVGILQIQAAVVQDVNRIYHTKYTWPDDARDKTISKEICRLYLSYWAMHFTMRQGRKATLKDLARIWNGGPAGWCKVATLPYWLKVQAVLNKANPKPVTA